MKKNAKSPCFANMGEFFEAYTKDHSILRHISGFSPELCEELGKMRFEHKYFSDTVKNDPAYLKGASQNEDFDWDSIPEKLYKAETFNAKLDWTLCFGFLIDCHALLKEMQEKNCINLKYQGKAISLSKSIELLASTEDLLDCISQFDSVQENILDLLCYIATENRYAYASINPDYAEKMAYKDINFFPYVPDERKTPALCMKAAESTTCPSPVGYTEPFDNTKTLLKFVPDSLKTDEICTMALLFNGDMLEFVPERYKTPDMCHVAVCSLGQSLKYVPESLKTPELCKRAVEWDGTPLQYVPATLKTPELCMAAVKNDGNALQFVPDELKSLEMSLLAIHDEPLVFKFVPMQFRNADICMAGILFANAKQADIPEDMGFPYKWHGDGSVKIQNMRSFAKLYSKENSILKNVSGFSEYLCRIIITHSYNIELNTAVLESEELIQSIYAEDLYFYYIHIQYNSPKILVALLESAVIYKHDDNVKDILQSMLDNKIFYLKAEQKKWRLETVLNKLKNNPEWFAKIDPLPKAVTEAICYLRPQVMRYLPNTSETSEILFFILSHHSYLEYIPDEFKTQKLCIAAVKNDWRELEYVPDNLKTPAMCETAVQDDGRALGYFPDMFKTYELCMEAVEDRGESLEFVPESLKTQKLCMLAMNSCSSFSSCFEYVPENFKTPEMCVKAVKTCSRALKYVPDSLINEELCKLAVRYSGWALDLVPESFKTKELCIEAIKEHGSTLEYVPENLKTRELCMLAIKNDISSLQYAPIDFLTPDMAVLYILNGYENDNKLYSLEFPYQCDSDITTNRSRSTCFIKNLK